MRVFPLGWPFAWRRLVGRTRSSGFDVSPPATWPGAHRPSAALSLPIAFTEPAVSIKARQYGDLFRRYIVPQMPFVVTLGVLLFTSLGLQLALPLIIRHFIDEAQGGAQLAVLAASAGIFIGIAVLQQVVQVFATYFSERVGWTATNNIREDLAEHALSLDMSYHNDRTPGEMIERVDGDPNELGKFFSLFIFEMLGSLVLLAGILLLLLREDWRAGLALTVFVVAGMAVLTSIRNIAVPYWKANREASADTFGFLEERLAGTEDIRSNDAKPYVMRRFHALMRSWYGKALKAGLMSSIMFSTTMFMFGVGSAILAVAGCVPLLRRRDQPGNGVPDLPLHADAGDADQPVHAAARQLPAGERGHLAHPGADCGAEDGPGPAAGGEVRAFGGGNESVVGS